MSPDEVARLFMPRKGSQRGAPPHNSAEAGGAWSSGQMRGGPHDGGPPGVSNTKSKKTTRGGPWPQKGEVMRGPGAAHQNSSSVNSVSMNPNHQPAPILPSQHRGAQLSSGNGTDNPGTSYLMLLPLNNSFEAKFIPLPYYPETLRIGRQTNAKTLPTPSNGYFDSKVLSRQHAEVWAEQKTGKVWIRDVKSSNGTFVNQQRLSQENRDSEPHELRAEDILELGIDIFSEDNKSIIHHKVAARVEHAGFQNGQLNVEMNNLGEMDQMMGNGGLISPQLNQQNNNFPRGRATSQNSRAGSMAGGQGMNHRGVPMFVHTISVEQIVKKLNSELHMAKQQQQELQRTSEFFDKLLSLEVVQRDPEIKAAVVEETSQSPMMDSGVALEPSLFSNSTHAPLPPPAKHITVIPEDAKQEDEEEKKDADVPAPAQEEIKFPEEAATEAPNTKEAETSADDTKPPKYERSIVIPADDVSPPSTGRHNTISRSPKDKIESPQHIFTLATQLRDARLELEVKSARVKDLEDLLRRERTAREEAEDRAAQLEVQRKFGVLMEKPSNHVDDDDDDMRDDISLAGSEATVVVGDNNSAMENNNLDASTALEFDEKDALRQQQNNDSANAAAEAVAAWQKRVEEMMAELKSAKEEIEIYKKQVRTAQEEGEHSRRTLAEMVAKIRSDDERRRRESAERKAAMVSCGVQVELEQEKEIGLRQNGKDTANLEDDVEEIDRSPSVENGTAKVGNGVIVVGGGGKDHQLANGFHGHHQHTSSVEFARKVRSKGEMAQNSAPYLSIVGVVFIGVGIMAFLNNWQKVER
ncbi:hypothetical protein DFH27DRAFT_525049 [Peziza echinospora]|nr:hypothetical protein DFH27DRAFT_525049 [Peziza echinospora]